MCGVMNVWVEHKWGNEFTNPPQAGSSGKILVPDVDRAQQTNEVKKLLQKKKTLLINAPPGCTTRVQPLDVSVNKPFKNAVKIQFEKHPPENLTTYVEEKIPAPERRVLLTTWGGNEWDEVCSNNEMLQHSFKKGGINIKEDGSENALVHIEGISEYVLPEADIKNSTWTAMTQMKEILKPLTQRCGKRFLWHQIILMLRHSPSLCHQKPKAKKI